MKKILKSILRIGDRYERLIVEEDLGGRPRKYRFLCDCGKSMITSCYQVTSGKTRSCGCLKIDLAKSNMTTHGMRRTREYKAWAEAKQRCNPASEKYKWYGARGISVAPEWADSFEAFYAHIGPCPDGFELDRIDNDKGYVPGNVRWVTHAENHANRGVTVRVLYQGEEITLAEYCRRSGVKYGTAWLRLKKGTPTDCSLAANQRGAHKMQ